MAFLGCKIRVLYICLCLVSYLQFNRIPFFFLGYAVFLLAWNKFLIQQFPSHCCQDGHPPLGWSDTLAYLVLPVLLIISQYISVQVMQPPQVC